MQHWMPIIIDVIALLIMLLCILIGYRQGFVYAVLRVLSWVIVAVGSYFAAVFLSNWIMSMTRDFWVSTTMNWVGTLAGEQASDITLLLATDLPIWFLPMTELLGLSVEGADQSGQLLDVLVDYLVLPVMTVLLSVVLFLLVFFLLNIFRLIWLRHLKTTELPVLERFNAVLGGLLGVLQGGAVLLLLGVAARLALFFMPTDSDFLSARIIADTTLFEWFYQTQLFTIV